MRKILAGTAFLALAGTACVAQTGPEPSPQADQSPLPGSIGVVVTRTERGLVVTEINEHAAQAGVRKGDVIVRYNGVAVDDPREFNRLVVDSGPRSTARVELLRAGAVHVLQVPVHQLDTVPRA